ncbi:MAG: ion transporter [Planctomycetota bacterium]
MNSENKRPVSGSYQLFMLILCLYALGALAAQNFVRFEPETQGILDYADFVVCALFFVDFVVSFLRAPDRWHYFVSWGWLDLLSSIPTLDVVRWGRAARVVRVFRVLRGLRATRLLASLVLRRRAENTFLAAGLVAILLVVFCSIAMLHFETEPESNIKTAEDSIWWAFATITTVGYGDRYPVTSEGRLIAGILMCAGVGLFGTFAGFLAAWFIGDPKSQSNNPDCREELASLREEMKGVREELNGLRKVMDHIAKMG